MPRQPLTTTSPTHPYLFTVNRSCRAPPLVGSFTSCARRFSSTQFRNLLESFLSVVLYFQFPADISLSSAHFLFLFFFRPNSYCTTDSCMIFIFLNFLRWYMNFFKLLWACSMFIPAQVSSNAKHHVPLISVKTYWFASADHQANSIYLKFIFIMLVLTKSVY